MTIIEADHLGKLIRARVKQSASQHAFTHQINDERVSLTWRELETRVLRFAERLWEFDARPGDRIALLAENSLDWVCTDLAIHLVGAVHVPIHCSLTGHQAAYQMLHAGAKVVVISNATQANKLNSLKVEEWKELAATADTSFDDFWSNVSFGSFAVLESAVIGRFSRQLADLLEKQILPIIPPKSWKDESKQELQFGRQIEAILDAAKPSDLATILYTSGTTGEPKGVMLTHGNLTSNAISAVQQLGETESDLRLNFLPLSHVFARTCDLYTWIAAGSRLELARSRETTVADLRTCGPTIFNTVPFFLERIYRYLADNNLLDSPTAAREMMGGNLRLVNSGGAALPNYLFDYFNEHGVPLFQGYGLSETSPIISCCGPGRFRRGSAGAPIPGVEVKISSDGEILTRGPHVMPGYYRNEAATNDVIKDGWFHTGDLGRLDEDNFIYITGRKKEIIVLSNGKNISPALIEGLLLRDPLFAQVVIFGDGHNVLVALVVPNFERLKTEFGDAAEKELIQDDRCKARYREILAERLTTLSPHEQIKNFALLEKPFSIDDGELTAKMSLRRNVIASRNSELIASLYRERSHTVQADCGLPESV